MKVAVLVLAIVGGVFSSMAGLCLFSCASTASRFGSAANWAMQQQDDAMRRQGVSPKSRQGVQQARSEISRGVSSFSKNLTLHGLLAMLEAALAITGGVLAFRSFHEKPGAMIGGGLILAAAVLTGISWYFWPWMMHLWILILILYVVAGVLCLAGGGRPPAPQYASPYPGDPYGHPPQGYYPPQTYYGPPPGEPPYGGPPQGPPQQGPPGQNPAGPYAPPGDR